MAVVSTRVDDTLKKNAQKLAEHFGISLSTLIHMWMKQFVRTKKISIELDDTDPLYYEDAIEVNEPAEVVLAYLQKLKERDEQAARKVSG